jgi:uroporphyrinogen decarboxylase
MTPQASEELGSGGREAATRRQRFVTALNHEEPDRVPIAFGGPECSINQAAHHNLLDYLGLLRRDPPVIIDNILQIVEPDERLYDVFDVDVRWLIPREGPAAWRDDHEVYVDEFGRTFRAGGSFYNQVDYPLKEGTGVELARYSFPDVTAPSRVEGLTEKAQSLYEAGYGLVGDGAWGIYEISSSLRGTENLFLDMALRLDYVETLALEVYEQHIKPFYSTLMETIGQWLQMVVVSDDYGGQQQLLFSPEVFRRVYKPLLADLVAHIKGLGDVKVYIHSDGAVAPLISDFREIGLDGLNPVQYTAAGMQANVLKETYRETLGFFGGGIDNEVLSFQSAEDVRSAVRQQITALAPGGGYLFATIHNISPEVPPANVVAFFEAGKEFGRYPIGAQP